MSDTLRNDVGPELPRGTATVRVHVLYFKGCPNSDATFELVRSTAAAQRGVVVEPIEVRSEDEARRLRFLGSPTVQVNGVDVDPDARERTDFALVCRLYRASGVPDRQLIEAAIREATA